MDDLKFISAVYLDPLPKSLKYFDQYFTTHVQKYFARYYVNFRETKHFFNHTGIKVDTRYLVYMEKAFIELEKMVYDARQQGDFEKLAEIESGNSEFRVRKNTKPNYISRCSTR